MKANDITTITIKRETLKKLTIARVKKGYKTMDELISALLKKGV